jgi:hypothetical protein
MIRAASILIIFATTLLATVDAAAQSAIKLVGRKSSEVELVFGKHSVIFDLDEVLIGTNGNLPGNPPHRYRTLFTTEKSGMIYVVANVQSGSPITTPMAACGGDRPQSLLWIEADKTLRTRRVQSEIYASCTYNYNNSKVKQDKSGITVLIGDEKKVVLRYENDHPEKGLVITKSFN